MSKYDELKERLSALLKENTKLRKVDQAEMLGVSEAELLTLEVGNNVTILNYPNTQDRASMKALLMDLAGLGKTMALTRNTACVHERKGIYENVTFYEGHANMGVAVNPDIDIRYFMNDWAYALAVKVQRPGAVMPSFQFFNKNGVAVHKIFLLDETYFEKYETIVEKYKSAEQSYLEIEVDPNYPPKKTYKTLDEIDVEAFKASWLGMKDTHDFFGLLGRFGISRIDAFKAAPEGYTQQVDATVFKQILAAAVEQEISVMCFVQNTGCVQIHTGQIHNIKTMDNWYNILDPEFNMHLREDLISDVWVVRKCTEDGIVTSIELFDAAGELIVYFFGARKPGIPELESWRQIVAMAEEQYKSMTLA